jgi:hypothetical protein
MTPCVDWTGCVDNYGYGRHGKNSRRAHRTAWARVHGPIPPEMVVMHLCDRPICVNVDHLQLGTQQENIQMAADRGHITHTRGERNHTARLAEADVLAIRQRHDESCSTIAAEYGVNHCTIRDILRGRTWRHLSW